MELEEGRKDSKTWAKEELDRLMPGDSEHDEEVKKLVMKLYETYSEEFHPDWVTSASLNLFGRLAKGVPLTPLYGTDDEWFYWYDEYGEVFINNRCSRVIKDKDGKCYDVLGVLFSDDGIRWYRKPESKIRITFPYYVPVIPEKKMEEK